MQILFSSEIDRDIPINVLEDYMIFLVWAQPRFCLIFTFSKNKVLQSGALLKMPPSSPSIKEFGSGDQKKKTLKEAKTFIFPKITKTH